MKQDVRRQFRKRRDALPEADRLAASMAVRRCIEASEPYRRASHVLFYASMGSEVPTWGFIEAARKGGKVVVLPRIGGDELTLHAWDGVKPLAQHSLGILEPEAAFPGVGASRIDVVLVPGLAFDRSGHRLGYGGGFYDRLLRRLHRGWRVGIAYEFQLVDRLPSEPHDERLDAIVTAGGVHVPESRDT
jgi:5-formyltetrahydrofolate cyclo-ligase